MVEKIEKKISKEERRKLRSIEKYTPQQLEDLLKQINLSNQKSIVETIGEPNYLKLGVCSDKHYNDKQCDE